MVDGLKKMPVRFCRSLNGAEPVRDWLNELPEPDRRLMGRDIAAVEFGWPIGMPLCRSLGGGLWEVRSNLTHGRIARVIFCVSAGHMVLLHGFVKKDAENPANGLGNGQETAKGNRKMIDENPHIGSAFSDWLAEQGLEEDAYTHAIKRVLAWQIEQAMKEQGISKNQMAKRIRTSRAYLDRFLDPENDKVQRDTIQRAAVAIGRKLRFELV